MVGTGWAQRTGWGWGASDGEGVDQVEGGQGGEMMMMKSVFWWRKPDYPEETTDLRHGGRGRVALAVAASTAGVCGNCGPLHVLKHYVYLLSFTSL